MHSSVLYNLYKYTFGNYLRPKVYWNKSVNWEFQGHARQVYLLERSLIPTLNLYLTHKQKQTERWLPVCN